MTTRIARFLTAYATAAALLALLGGCAADVEKSDDAGRPAEEFRPVDEVSDVTRINDQQIAAGARTDATLRPYHFYEADLNSLGREKLDLMLKDGAGAGGLVVYLDVPAAGDKRQLADARRGAVAEYLASRGLAEDSFRLERGHNPDNTFPAVPARGVKPAAPDAASEQEMGPDPAYGGGLSGPMAKQ
jgi:hypothetical protein